MMNSTLSAGKYNIRSWKVMKLPNMMSLQLLNDQETVERTRR